MCPVGQPSAVLGIGRLDLLTPELRVEMLQLGHGERIALHGRIIQPPDLGELFVGTRPAAQPFLQVLWALRGAEHGAHGVGFAAGLLDQPQLLEESHLVCGGTGAGRIGEWSGRCRTGSVRRSARAGDQIGLATEELDAVGGDEVKVRSAF